MGRLARITNKKLEPFRLNFSGCTNRDVAPLTGHDGSRVNVVFYKSAPLALTVYNPLNTALNSKPST